MPLTVNAALSKDKHSGKGVSLQHRHFAFIAGVIADIGADDIRATTAIRFAGECQATNSNFDWERFMRACNVTTAQEHSAKKLDD